MSSKAQQYAQQCNNHYASSTHSPINSLKPDPGPPPTAKIAIITCMDARIDPFAMFSLSLGEAHVIRPGGGRAPDAYRSLLASQHVLGTDEIMVIHHTDCGFSEAPAQDVAYKIVCDSAGGWIGDVNFMNITDGPEKSVREDVGWLRKNPYIKSEKVSGWVYDTAKGTIKEVQC